MKLDRLILVNWGQLRPGDYEMGDMTLLTGETGSGKSTMLDGLQTVMTAAYKGILNYNPGQDEVTQGQRRGKTKRALESYVVGAEYSKFSRPDGAQGFMAAVFRPGKDEGHLKPFTALVAASARVDGSGDNRQARLENTELVIINNAALSFQDFMLNEEAGEWVAVERVVSHLKSKYPQVTDYGDKKRDYLSGLYGRFRGKNSVTWDEAFHAAKAWVQSIAYRPIGSVHELVRDEILDFDGKQLQQDIERISGLMRQVTNLRKEGLRLESSIASLSELKSIIGQTTKAHEQHVLQEMLLAKLHLKIDDETIVANRRKIKSDEEVTNQESAKIDGWKSRLGGLDKRRIALEAKLLGIPAHGQKQDIDKKLADATDTARSTLNTLCVSLMAAGLLEQRARALIALPVPTDFPKLSSSILSVATALKQTELSRLAEYQAAVLAANADKEINVERLFNLVQAFNSANVGIDQVYTTLVGSDESVSLTVAVEASTLEQRIADVGKRVAELGSKKAKLASGGVNYPRHVEITLGRLREQFPRANAQVLCDLVEPISEDWQLAIEGYLDGARFNIIVDTEWEARALDFIKAKNMGGKLVQGSFCLKHAATKMLPPDSIVHELKSANPIAWAYLVDQFGSVVKVESSEALRFTPRGLTRDGKASGGRTMFTCEIKDMVFGQKARKSSLERVAAELEIEEDTANQLNQHKGRLDEIKQLLQGLKEPHFDASPLSAAANSIVQMRDALSQLDLKELIDINLEVTKVNEEISIFNGNIESAKTILIQLKSSIDFANNAIKSIEDNKLARLDAVDRQIVRIKKLAEDNAQLTYTLLATQVEEMLKSSGKEDLEAARREADRLSKLPYQLLGDVRESLSEYNNRSRADERFLAALPHVHDATSFDQNYSPLVTLARSVSETLENLQGIGLYNNRAELHSAEKSFHDVFTKQFCVEIKSKVDDGIRTLRQMNNELRNLKFGSDRFSIDWSKWEPEFADYLSFFEAVTTLADSSEAVDLFGETELLPKHIEVRDRLVKLLLDDDQERATKELMRIADYRNYRRYDILNESDSGGRIRLSEWGTGSGGQLETPAYIVRAAVVTNRLKLFEKGPSLKLLANDESFAKMDEPRARAVMGFLRDNLDLQLISAMPTMKAGALKDEFTREYSFTRLGPVENGELDFVSECDERVFKTDKMRELWAQQRKIARENAKQLFDINDPAPATEGTLAATATALPDTAPEPSR